jgi:hypothetical protein
MVASLNGQTCNTSNTLPDWVNCVVAQQVAQAARETTQEARTAPQAASDARQTVRQQLIDAADPTQQASEPAIAQNANTLADRSSAPDVAGVSVNLGQLASKSRTPDTSNIGVTVSMYGLYSAFRQQSPFDQSLYDDNNVWRRFSFSLSEAFPEDSTSTASQGSYSTQAKFLLSHSRDVGDSSNQRAINEMASLIAGVKPDVAFAKIYGDIQQYLYDHRSTTDQSKSLVDFIGMTRDPGVFPTIRGGINEAQLQEIRQIILKQIQPLVKAQQIKQDKIDQITSVRQYSVDFSTRNSKGTGANLYRSEFIADTPLNKLTKGLTATTNISWDFQNAQTAKMLNRQIARAVEQFQYTFGSRGLVPPKNPFTIMVSGEGDWGTNGTPIYKAQFQLGIPVVSGLTLPLSFFYASQTAMSTHADAKVQLGIVIDSGKLAHAFKTP